MEPDTNPLHQLRHPVRFVTATALFDGHDAAINIMRRILQSQGVEVIHLGHNRSVAEIVDAAVEEDVQGIAISSYQGGHVEFFEYLVESLAKRDAGHIKVYGGGGGVIVPEEIERLKASGVHIFSPKDGQKLGLARMINTLVAGTDADLWDTAPITAEEVMTGDRLSVARAITGAEKGIVLPEITAAAAARRTPVLGVTGTGGSGKSSLTDELVRRFRLDQEDKLRIADLAVDPNPAPRGRSVAGRPDPYELPGRVHRLLPIDGDPWRP